MFKNKIGSHLLKSSNIKNKITSTQPEINTQTKEHYVMKEISKASNK